MQNEDSIVDLNAADPELPNGMCRFLALGKTGLRRRRRRDQESKTNFFVRHQIPSAGAETAKNYLHRAELCRPRQRNRQKPPPELVAFRKFAAALRVHGEPIVIPRLTNKVITKRNSWP